jgi:hypothetical protein
MRAPETPSTGLQRARTGRVSTLKNVPPKQHLHESLSGLPVRGRATTVAAESLIAQVH